MSRCDTSPDFVLQKIQQLQSQIKLLQGAEITQEKRGFSQTLCLSVKKGNQQYFVKVYADDCRAKLQEIAEVYQAVAIPTAKIIDLVYLPESNETICIYEYISGPTLKELMKTSDTKTCEEVGRLVGIEMRKYTQIKVDTNNQFPAEFQQKLNQFWQNIFQQKLQYLQLQPHQESQTKKLPAINLHRLQKSCRKLQNPVAPTSPIFTHGDLNLSNVIIQNNQPVFIDIADGEVGYRVLDFRGICWWGWTGNKIDKESAIYRGIFQGIFNNNIPDSFHQELAFAVVYNLLWRVNKYQNLPEQTYYSFLRWHDIFTKTNYFENYQFPWF